MSYLTDGFVGCLPLSEGDESVASVEPGHGVHHEPQVPDGAALFEEGDELVLVHVAGNLPAEYFTAVSRGVALPIWRRPAVLPLARGHVQLVPGPLQDLANLNVIN